MSGRAVSLPLILGVALVAVYSTAGQGAGAGAPVPPEPRDGPEAVVRGLTRAIDYFDLEAFRASFSDDVTMFYPIPSLLERVDGREALVATQKRVFDGLGLSFREAGKTEPPYFGLRPSDLRVQWLGDRAAVVTWHVDRGQHLGRRTAVVERRPEGWLIVSYHASNLEKRAD